MHTYMHVYKLYSRNQGKETRRLTLETRKHRVDQDCKIALITRQNKAFRILRSAGNRDSLGGCQSPRDTLLVFLFDRVQRAGENRHLLHPRQCPHGDLKFTREILFSSIKCSSARYSERDWVAGDSSAG